MSSQNNKNNLSLVLLLIAMFMVWALGFGLVFAGFKIAEYLL